MNIEYYDLGNKIKLILKNDVSLKSSHSQKIYGELKTGIADYSEGLMRIFSNGEEIYFNEDGFLHRENNRPARIKFSGRMEYYYNSERHRENGPAIVYPNGDYIYYIFGRRHRLNGPASLLNSSITWCENGLVHRLDGPAYISENKNIFYFVNGHDITKQVNAWIEQLGIRPWEEWTDVEKVLFRLEFQQEAKLEI